jgi:hypothetical protein
MVIVRKKAEEAQPEKPEEGAQKESGGAQAQ